MSKRLCFFYYFGKSLIVLCVATVNISIASFATVIGIPVRIARASFSLTFSISTRIVKELLKTTRNKKKKHNKIVMLARSKLNDELEWWSIRMMNSQRNDTEKNNLIEEGKKIGINEVIQRNEIINYNLKS